MGESQGQGLPGVQSKNPLPKEAHNKTRHAKEKPDTFERFI